MKSRPYNINLVSSNLHGSTRHTLNCNLSPAGVAMPNFFIYAYGYFFIFTLRNMAQCKFRLSALKV